MAGMAKNSTWTKAMRKRAAEHGRRGDREAKRRGGQLGGAVAWVTRTPEQQEAIRERLRALGRGRQTNKGKAAREAQRERALAGMAYLSERKAQFLADMGMLRREAPAVPAPAPAEVTAPEVAPVPPVPRIYTSTDPRPVVAHYPSMEAFKVDFMEWLRVRREAGLTI
jgi:hypothetical protein